MQPTDLEYNKINKTKWRHLPYRKMDMISYLNFHISTIFSPDDLGKRNSKFKNAWVSVLYVLDTLRRAGGRSLSYVDYVVQKSRISPAVS